MSEEELKKLSNIQYKPWIELTNEEIQLFEKNDAYIKKMQQENTQLKQQLKDKDEKISKVREYCNEKLKWNRNDGNDYWAGINNAEQQVSSDILEKLESNKED